MTRSSPSRIGPRWKRSTNATGGADWLTDTNWLTDAPLGDWHGVTVDEEGRVTALELSGNGLARSIPLTRSGLTSLTTLDLSNNSLVGGIPSSLSRFTSLRVLDLSSNDLPGSIAWVAGFESLVELDLSHNRFEGPIPPGDRLPHRPHRVVAGRQLVVGADSRRTRRSHEPYDPVVVVEQSRRADSAGTRRPLPVDRAVARGQ